MQEEESILKVLNGHVTDLKNQSGNKIANMWNQHSTLKSLNYRTFEFLNLNISSLRVTTITKVTVNLL